MLDLTFFTSNPIKLAHARYLAEGLPLTIKGFRQRTYHADYNEPRLSTSGAILEASYRSAVAQMEKAGLSLDSHFFFLEDTSVRVDSLSTGDEDIPGVDIKYWMQAQTFPKLDAELKSKGGNRSATVRSHVLLHIPANYKQKWGLSADYLVFVGEQNGHICEFETSFATNLVFPWLDNQTFNKWFIPQGAERPLGSLPIHEADKVDFRAKSLGKMLKFLRKHNLLTRVSKQRELPLQNTPSYILCGYTCAGKTTASQFLARRTPFLHIEASDFMHLCFYYRHDAGSDLSVSNFAEMALSEKPEIAAEKIAEYIEGDVQTPVVISGFRSPGEIDYIRDRLSADGRQFLTVFIDCRQEARFSRMTVRGRSGDESNFDNFKDKDEQQRRMGLDTIASRADTTHWENEGSLEDYLNLVTNEVTVPLGDVIDTSAYISALRDRIDIRFEDAVLFALLSVWSETEKSEFLTTARIAKLTAELFPQSTKHKDNVSRYFNQDFYPYYEIDIGNSGIRRYRLSNTGYGRAIRRLSFIAGPRK